ncbi:STAS domain-containing protein [Hymenobacter negativus]|uniref:STAS domain-containing protein n=1 Tax=Hymenobacter negativus TaxID=2795026 RepID=UPI0018DCF2FD|nr:STAS domain-containing protein [Hymenobacter negativus]MBH8567868.1 STAS domain-containing protein [Hymenobacter negativus]
MNDLLRPSPRKSFIEWRGNVIILSIGKDYDMEKLSEIMALYNSEAIKRATNIIVDIGELTSINVIGLEILLLKEKLANQGPYSVVFCGLKPEIRTIFERLGSEEAFGELVNFNSVDETLDFLRRV